MQRREFIALLGGAVVAWPLATHAQQSERTRRIGVLLGQAVDDQQGQARIAAFLRDLQNSGVVDGSNVQIDIRWGAGNVGEIRRHASELVAMNPDVIVASGSAT